MIEPLLVHAEEDGSQMYCEFEVPGTGEIVSAKASIKRLNTLKSQFTRSLKRNAMYEVRRMAGRFMRQLFGSGFLGRTGRQMMNTTMRNNDISRGYTDEEKEAAIVDAFKRVSSKFEYDAESGKWVTPRQPESKKPVVQKEQSAFEKQISSAPITNKYDKMVIARMLVEVAAADGHIADEERDFLSTFISGQLGSVESLQRQGPLSRIEIEELSPKVQSTAYMIAWAISLVDLDLDPKEEALLEEYGNMMRLSDKDRTNLKQYAQYHILEGTLSMEMSREDLLELGRGIGLSDDDAERCKIRWMKRQ